MRPTKRRTYHVHRLPLIDGRLLNQTFTDCTFIGPGALLFSGKPRNIVKSPYVRDVIYLGAAGISAQKPKQGLINVDNCEFIRCHFRTVALVGEPEMIDELRAVAQVLPN